MATIGYAATLGRSGAACDAPSDVDRLCTACRLASGLDERWRMRWIGPADTPLLVYALGRYRDVSGCSPTPCASLLRQFKYAGDRAAGRVLARLLAAAPPLPIPSDAVLVPIPLHPRRLRKRGFNQAAWLARALAKRNRNALSPGALACAIDAPSRARMSRRERHSASAQLFHAGRDRARTQMAVPVDDVCTTGATLCAATSALGSAGFRVPFAVVLLSTERSDDNVDAHERRGPRALGEDLCHGF